MTTTTGGIAAHRVRGFGRFILQNIEEADLELLKV
jgi:hypothetical protein